MPRGPGIWRERLEMFEVALQKVSSWLKITAGGPKHSGGRPCRAPVGLCTLVDSGAPGGFGGRMGHYNCSR